MKITKRNKPKYPTKVTFSNGRKVIVPRQSKFKTPWLRKHGCPFVSQYMALKYCGVTVKPMELWKYARKHLKKYMGGTLTNKGVAAELKHFLKGKAHVKRFAPKDVKAANLRKYLNAGSIIIMVRKSPTSMIHYYVIGSDKGQTYILDKGKCKKTTVKKELKKKSNNKKYGGVIVVTPYKKGGKK